MTIEERLSKLETQVKNLNASIIQMQKNQTPVTNKVDDTANKVVQMTPYTDMAMGYIDDTEVVFRNVPNGNMSIFFDNPTEYTYVRDGSTVVISFEPLEQITVITISIQ